MSTPIPLDKHGLHAQNAPFAAFPLTPGGPASPETPWWRAGATSARWLKLMEEEHTPADARAAQSLGMRVLVRAKGEGIVHHEAVSALIAAYAGLAAVIEVGNEPYPTAQYPDWGALLWNHAAYLEAVWQHCAGPAHAVGIALCAPGWQGTLDPPHAGQVLPGPGGVDFVMDAALADRLLTVYRRFDAIAIHVYDPFDLLAKPPQAHLTAWRAAFPTNSAGASMPFYCTEYGIASRAINDTDKALRYAAFIRALPGYVVAAFCFILGSAQWCAFDSNGQPDPNGENGYCLSNAAWWVLGQAIMSRL